MKCLERCCTIRHLLIVGFLVLSSSLLSSRAFAVQKEESAGVQDLLYQARQESVGLDQDADQMEMLVRSDLDWQTHATALEAVEVHVNRLGEITAKLQAERENASPWQQQTIDRVVPMLREIATNTTNAITHLNQNQSRPVSGDYPTWLRANAETAHELAQLISDTIEYGQTRSRLEKLAAELQINTPELKAR